MNTTGNRTLVLSFFSVLGIFFGFGNPGIYFPILLLFVAGLCKNNLGGKILDGELQEPNPSLIEKLYFSILNISVGAIFAWAAHLTIAKG